MHIPSKKKQSAPTSKDTFANAAVTLNNAPNMSTAATPTEAAAEAGSTSSYPDLASPTDSVIAGDFGAMSAEEQEKQREEWKAELVKTEEEIATLKQVLGSKELHAAGLKRRLGITAWREFSEDMTQGLKAIQESQGYKKAQESLKTAGEKTASLWSSFTNSSSYQAASSSVGSAFGAAAAAAGGLKNKMPASMSTQGLSSVLTGKPATTEGSVAGSPTSETAENGSNGAAAK